MGTVDNSRRLWLGAMAAAPLDASFAPAAFSLAKWDAATIGRSVAAPALAASSDGWMAVRAAFDTADKAMNAYNRDVLSPASDRFMDWRGQWPVTATAREFPEMAVSSSAAHALYDPIEKRHDELVSAREDAMNAMLNYPAPDLSAVAYKIEASIKDDRWEYYGFDKVMDSLLSDLRRLGAQ